MATTNFRTQFKSVFLNWCPPSVALRALNLGQMQIRAVCTCSELWHTTIAEDDYFIASSDLKNINGGNELTFVI